MKNLYLIRGLPGAGKTTFANNICKNVFAADDYFYRTGEYIFDIRYFGVAHGECQSNVANCMHQTSEDIAVANTFTEEWEFDVYQTLAERYGYTVFYVIVENRHGNKNVHGCPDEKVEEMRSRFDIVL